MRGWIAIVFLAVGSFAFSKSAQAVTACQGKTLVVFGNGMYASPSDAVTSRNELKRWFQMSLPPSSPLKQELVYEVAYADNNGATSPASLSGLGQLLEAYIQKSGDSTALFWKWLYGLIPGPAWFSQAMQDIAAQTGYQVMAGDPDLQLHLSDIYLPALQEGKRVLIVSHSQGNFYANAAYAALSAQYGANVGNVQVATPASFVASGGPHVTAAEDLVIGAVRAAAVAGVPGIAMPLPPNVTNVGDGTSRDILGHSFIGHYLAGLSTRPMILSAMAGILQGLQYPQATVTGGAITVTLTWAHATDVDLHVFEPGGAHVYYANRQGASGYLDVDNTWGFGPEHYFVACNTVQSGTYAVGVNYYSGWARPETATIKIKAGTLVKTFTKVLSAPLYSSGNSSPSPVANIQVTANPNGGWDFSVQ